MNAPQRRSDGITHAIARALDNENDRKARTWGKSISNFFGLFSLFHLDLTRHQYADFHTLRHDFWDIDDDDYASSFRSHPPGAQECVPSLEPAGNLGYSGSSFFHTTDGKYLVKSLDRASESDFFVQELCDPYAAHMRTHPSSLLIRITDMLYAPRATIGTILGIQPRHYIVMENLLHGLGDNPQGASGGTSGGAAKWETFDLKPDDYFYPERDVAGGRLASDQVKDGLVDEFPDRIHAASLVKQELIDILLEDTKFLARSNVVDYSLFLARFPKSEVAAAASASASASASALASATATASAADFEDDDATTATLVSPSWRTGVPSTDGKWIYRAVLLDFLWAKHKARAQTMTGLVGAFNLLFKKGPMSITTEPGEYRARFMDMVERLLWRQDEGSQGGGSAAG
ncbi:hypothetical protein E4U42_004962 [Claviceps africana]|uniref:PIPK domain-containing protein n=1 Tax=Claviceps africana TaxID=83212 RepID=A0A8K0J5F5_9HYPO|nr:hypothetical protein E4U42_004962 [Claviceps africana]